MISHPNPQVSFFLPRSSTTTAECVLNTFMVLYWKFPNHGTNLSQDPDFRVAHLTFLGELGRDQLIINTNATVFVFPISNWGVTADTAVGMHWQTVRGVHPHHRYHWPFATTILRGEKNMNIFLCVGNVVIVSQNHRMQLSNDHYLLSERMGKICPPWNTNDHFNSFSHITLTYIEILQIFSWIISFYLYNKPWKRLNNDFKFYRWDWDMSRMSGFFQDPMDKGWWHKTNTLVP